MTVPILQIKLRRVCLDPALSQDTAFGSVTSVSLFSCFSLLHVYVARLESWQP